MMKLLVHSAAADFIARLLKFGFDPNEPRANDEDYAKMPPPTPHIVPYDSER